MHATSTRNFAFALLPLVGALHAPVHAADPPRTGTYHCVAAGGVAGTLQLIVRSKTEYEDRSGKTGSYSFDPATGKLTFKSGAWAGYFGKVFSPTKIGLASRDNGYYGTTCDLK